MKKTLFGLVLVGCLSVYIYAPFFASGIPHTHDGQMHLARIANYFIAYKQGQWPVRWAPNLNNGFGYPVFNYNYPFAYVLSIPFISIGFSIEETYKILVVMALLTMASGIFILVPPRLRIRLRVLGALSMISSPYVANLVYVRGGIGELWSLALLPLVLWLIEQQNVNGRSHFRWIYLSVGLASWMLSHNTLMLIGLPLVALYMFLRIQSSARSGYPLALAVSTALLLVSFFWIPALFEKNLIQLDGSLLSNNFQQHALTVQQFFIGVFDYGFSMPGPVDGLDLSLGWFHSFALLGFVSIMLKKQQLPTVLKLSLSLILVVFVFSTMIGNTFTHFLPGFNYIQFPWRLLSIAAIVLSLAVPLVMQQLKIGGLFPVLLILILIQFSRNTYTPSFVFSFSDHYYLETGQTTSTLDENMPRGFDKFKAYPLNNSVFANASVHSTEQFAEFDIVEWNGSNREFVVRLPEPGLVIERTAAFAGWQTRVNNELLSYVEAPDEFAGLIAYRLPAGEHRVHSRFTQLTRARVWGNTLSGLGVIILGVVSAWEWRRAWLDRRID